MTPFAGLLFAGDEAKTLNETWLFLLWTSDFSPFLTDSLASRVVMCLASPALRHNTGWCEPDDTSCHARYREILELAKQPWIACSRFAIKGW